MFGPERDEVIRERRKLHSEELNDLYSSPNIVQVIKSRRMRWAGHVVRVGDRRGAYRVLLGRSEGKRSLGRSGIDGRGILKMILKTKGHGAVDWIDLAQDTERWWAVLNAVMNLRVS